METKAKMGGQKVSLFGKEVIDQTIKELSNLPVVENNEVTEKITNVLADVECANDEGKKGITEMLMTSSYDVIRSSAQRTLVVAELNANLDKVYAGSKDPSVPVPAQLQLAEKYIALADIHRALSCESAEARKDTYSKLGNNPDVFMGCHDIALIALSDTEHAVVSYYNNFYGNEQLLNEYANATDDEARQMFLSNIELAQGIIFKVDVANQNMVVDRVINFGNYNAEEVAKLLILFNTMVNGGEQ